MSTYLYIYIYHDLSSTPPPDVPPFLATQRLDVGSCEVRAEAAAPVVQVEVGGSNLPLCTGQQKSKFIHWNDTYTK